MYLVSLEYWSVAVLKCYHHIKPFCAFTCFYIQCVSCYIWFWQSAKVLTEEVSKWNVYESMLTTTLLDTMSESDVSVDKIYIHHLPCIATMTMYPITKHSTMVQTTTIIKCFCKIGYKIVLK